MVRFLSPVVILNMAGKAVNGEALIIIILVAFTAPDDSMCSLQRKVSVVELGILPAYLIEVADLAVQWKTCCLMVRVLY
jgi:hypothetical protein